MPPPPRLGALRIVSSALPGAGVSLLKLSRFEPNTVQQADALFGIRALFAGLPCLFYTAAALLLSLWPRSFRTCVSASQESAFSAAKVPKAMV